MTTVINSTLITGIAGGRRFVRDVVGGRHAINVQTVSAASTVTSWRSPDGAIWVSPAALDVAGSEPSVFLTDSQRLFMVYIDGNGDLAFRHCGISDTAWSSATIVYAPSPTLQFVRTPDIVAYAEAGNSNVQRVHIVFGLSSVSGADTYYTIQHLTFTVSGGTGATIGGITYAALSTPQISGGNDLWRPSLDFHHTGDCWTVQGATPHLYVSWLAFGTNGGSPVIAQFFRKGTYSAGSWTWGGTRQIANIDFASSDPTQQGIFDGSQYVMVASGGGLNTLTYVSQRDAADTTTTVLDNATVIVGTHVTISFSFGTKDVWVAYHRASDTNPTWVRYDRDTATWTAPATLSGPTTARGFSLKRGSFTPAADAVMEVVYGDSSGNPYTYDAIAVPNEAPSAPTWAQPPSNGLARDVNAALLLDWEFSDPANGYQTQHSYALRRQIGAGAYAYWNATSSTWGAGETQNVTSATSVTLASGWGSGADADHKYAVKVWDNGTGNPTSGYGTERSIVPSVKVNPTITAPADSSTIATATTTATWTVSEQTAYLLELLDASDVQLWTSGWVSGGATSRAIDYEMSDGLTYKVRLTTRNNEGLDSTADVNTFSVDYEEPATPTLAVAAVGGALVVTITNPTPVGAQPTVLYNDLYVRIADGIDAYRDTVGKRIATLLPDDGVFSDWGAASTVDYEYLVRAVGDNQTFADSAWT